MYEDTWPNRTKYKSTPTHPKGAYWLCFANLSRRSPSRRRRINRQYRHEHGVKEIFLRASSIQYRASLFTQYHRRHTIYNIRHTNKHVRYIVHYIMCRTSRKIGALQRPKMRMCVLHFTRKTQRGPAPSRASPIERKQKVISVPNVLRRTRLSSITEQRTAFAHLVYCDARAK